MFDNRVMSGYGEQQRGRVTPRLFAPITRPWALAGGVVVAERVPEGFNSCTGCGVSIPGTYAIKISPLCRECHERTEKTQKHIVEPNKMVPSTQTEPSADDGWLVRVNSVGESLWTRKPIEIRRNSRACWVAWKTVGEQRNGSCDRGIGVNGWKECNSSDSFSNWPALRAALEKAEKPVSLLEATGLVAPKSRVWQRMKLSEMPVGTIFGVGPHMLCGRQGGAFVVAHAYDRPAYSKRHVWPSDTPYEVIAEPVVEVGDLVEDSGCTGRVFRVNVNTVEYRDLNHDTRNWCSSKTSPFLKIIEKGAK